MCSSFNGYDCRCERLDREQLATLLTIVAAAGERAWRVRSVRAAWGEIIGQVRASPCFRPLLHGTTFVKSARAVKLNLEQLVALPLHTLNDTRATGYHADAAALALRIRTHRERAAEADGAAGTTVRRRGAGGG